MESDMAVRLREMLNGEIYLSLDRDVQREVRFAGTWGEGIKRALEGPKAYNFIEHTWLWLKEIKGK